MSGTGKVISNENKQRKILEPEAKVEILKGQNIYTVIYGAPGDDSRPLPNDSVVFVENENIGGKSAVGFLDTKNPPVSGDGERRLYSRDEAGDIVAIIFIKKDGSIQINNGSDFAVRFGDMEAAFNELQSKFNAHVHPGVSTGGGSTGATTTQSTGDISLSKIDKINLP